MGGVLRTLTVLLAVGALLAGVCAAPWPLQQRLACPELPRPQYTDYAKMARWLVHQLEWGTVSTISRHLGGTPFGNALSFGDGPRCQPTGRLLFYLTTMDATAQDLAYNSNASLTICEAQLEGSCSGVDPEDPTCAKLSLSGSLERVPAGQVEEAERLLFSRHPDMRGWPAGHAFHIYELHIATARLLDWFGGAHDISAPEYFAAELRDHSGEAIA
ncbi:hypothetical protein CHLNCDRAFT_136925 [Chlorella variabilis]|uniref:CREG-like beta-barrel domain-containing protein n=1 Tax=Chlorella variabilis TaxID=554065 RepID=E1ZLL2_CHLVA|nr:hypothetical protein CHLNCDRAFT_136925 [Chlorella variabilis]EFN53152.1 hypothetical protein CHLNCDRAFT_136925 [Chlorella variabilis]|eukprot:XP_005845254.1 hypothetical protein CHLNCDRAFT_136925 [Chlorella variabilis]